MDRWILSRLNTLVAEVDDHLENYRIPETARALQDFVDELSNWYVRRCRERFWVQGDDQPTSRAAYMTLYTALVTVAKAAAPMIPFMSEEIYRNLVCSLDPAAPESVHLCSFPKADPAMMDKKLEEDMDEVLQVVTLGRAARNAANRKNRQPLARAFVQADHGLDAVYQEIIREELNIKELEFVSDASRFTSYTFKPQLKVVGTEIRQAGGRDPGGPGGAFRLRGQEGAGRDRLDCPEASLGRGQADRGGASHRDRPDPGL